MKKSSISFFVVAAATLSVFANDINAPSGIPIGKRMTLRPYVSLSYTFDSNIDSDHTERSGSIWIASPALDLTYKSDNWDVTARAWYDYHAYESYSEHLDASSYGETLSLNWQEYSQSPRGWKLVLTERYQKISQDDDLSNHGGRGLGRDRQVFQVDGVLGRHITEKFHTALSGGYYYLDYDNDSRAYAPLYGWRRALAGGEAGYAFSKWFDLLFASSYSWYWQDNNINRTAGWDDTADRKISDTSAGWTISAGFGSHMTERISYRALIGWSRFDYSEGLNNRDNAVYSLTANWKVSDTFNVMLLGSSYYQPSEREWGSSIMVSTLGLGLGKTLVRGKLSSTLDLTYRHEQTEYHSTQLGDYDEDIITGRIGLNYHINRYVSLFGRMEYQNSITSGGNGMGSIYDYDRFRGTFGVRLSY